MANIIEVLDPTAQAEIKETTSDRYIDDLNNRVIGFLDNSKPNIDLFLAQVEKVLRQRFHFTDVLHTGKRKVGLGAGVACPEEALNELASRCDVVVNGIGDWGSCVSWSVHDSIYLERKGVVTATICSSEFASLGRLVAKAEGMAELPLVVVPHPIGGLSPDEVRARADKAIDEIVKVLTRSSTGQVKLETAGKAEK